MSELREVKFHEMNAIKLGLRNDKLYFKSEADKVIAEKDAKIARLKATPEEIMKEVFDKVIIYPHEMVRLEDAYKLAVALRRSNRKYCLAMAQEWRNYAAFCGMQSSCRNHRGFGKTAEHWSWKQCHAWRCMHHWLELAEEPTWAKFLQLIHKEAT